MAENNSHMPWFPFDASRWLLSIKQARMTPAEAGVYIRLLAREWLDTPLPEDEQELADLAGCDLDEFKEHWARVKRCFIEAQGGLVNEVLEEIRGEQMERHEKAVKSGRKGGKAPKKPTS